MLAFWDAQRGAPRGLAPVPVLRPQGRQAHVQPRRRARGRDAGRHGRRLRGKGRVPDAPRAPRPPPREEERPAREDDLRPAGGHRGDDEAPPLRGDDLVGLRPRGKPVGRLDPDRHGRRRVRHAHAGRALARRAPRGGRLPLGARRDRGRRRRHEHASERRLPGLRSAADDLGDRTAHGPHRARAVGRPARPAREEPPPRRRHDADGPVPEGVGRRPALRRGGEESERLGPEARGARTGRGGAAGLRDPSPARAGRLRAPEGARHRRERLPARRGFHGLGRAQAEGPRRDRHVPAPPEKKPRLPDPHGVDGHRPGHRDGLPADRGRGALGLDGPGRLRDAVHRDRPRLGPHRGVADRDDRRLDRRARRARPLRAHRAEPPGPTAARSTRPRSACIAREGTVVSEKTYETPADLAWDDETYRGDAYPVFGWGCDIAEVEVDLDTFETTVHRLLGRAGRRQGHSSRSCARGRSRAERCRRSAGR